MDLTFQFPDELGRRLQDWPNANAFVVQATQAAFEKQALAQELAESAAQGDRGEYADPKDIERFFDKWNADAG